MLVPPSSCMLAIDADDAGKPLTKLYPTNKVDWRDRVHWHCNNNVHPSRHGTYGGVSLNPLETMFVKSTWHVGEPYTSAFTRWMLQDEAVEQDSPLAAMNDSCFDVRPRAIKLLCSDNATAPPGCP